MGVISEAPLPIANTIFFTVGVSMMLQVSAELIILKLGGKGTSVAVLCALGIFVRTGTIWIAGRGGLGTVHVLVLVLVESSISRESICNILSRRLQIGMQHGYRFLNNLLILPNRP